MKSQTLFASKHFTSKFVRSMKRWREIFENAWTQKQCIIPAMIISHNYIRLNAAYEDIVDVSGMYILPSQ